MAIRGAVKMLMSIFMPWDMLLRSFSDLDLRCWGRQYLHSSGLSLISLTSQYYLHSLTSVRIVQSRGLGQFSVEILHNLQCDGLQFEANHPLPRGLTWWPNDTLSDEFESSRFRPPRDSSVCIYCQLRELDNMDIFSIEINYRLPWDDSRSVLTGSHNNVIQCCNE